MNCTVCGAVIQDRARFCNQCGVAVTQVQPAVLAPPSGLDLYLQGRRHWVEGRLEQAKAAYRQAIACEPGLPNTYYELAQLMETTGESPAETMLIYKQFISLARAQPDFSAHVQFAQGRVQAIKAAGWQTKPPERPAPALPQPKAAAQATPQKQQKVPSPPIAQQRVGGIRAINQAFDEYNEGIKFARNVQNLAGDIESLFADEQPVQPAAQPAHRYRAPAGAVSSGPGAMTRFFAFILRWVTLLLSLAALIMAVVTLLNTYEFGSWWIFLSIFGIVGLILSRSAKSSKPNLGRYNWFMLIYAIISLVSGAVLFLL